MRIFAFLIIFLVIRSIIRSARKQKQPARPAPPPVKAPEPFDPWSEPQSGEGSGQSPASVYADSVAQPAVSGHHHHRETVVTEADGYAGEGDPERYFEREICCETDHTEPQPAASFTLPDADALVTAVVWSEILGKPKAYRPPYGGVRS